MINNQCTARAIDVGFGRVKFSFLSRSGKIDYGSFPSLALPSETRAISSAGNKRRDTFNVPVRGAHYEVGVDIRLAQSGGDFGRDVSDEFYRSSIYEALTKGAMLYMWNKGDRVIDILVLGLPLNQFNDGPRREFLRTQFKGKIDLGEGRQLEVLEVVVQAQPMGAYVCLEDHLNDINLAISTVAGGSVWIDEVESLEENSILIVDPGEHTLDWLLIQQGTVNERSSGAASDAGRHRVVKAVKDALAAQVGRPLGPSVTFKVDEALQCAAAVKLAGVTHDLACFEPVAMAVVQDSVNRLVDGLRGAQEIIDLIVVVGGHPERYAKTLCERFPSIPVFIAPNSAFANVRGFQKIGEALWEARQLVVIH